MAVPFISPVENIDELIEVLILIFLSRRHMGRIEDNELQGRIEDLMKLLMEYFQRQALFVNTSDNQKRIMVLVREELQFLRTASTTRTRRRTTNSESSYWEDKLGDLDITHQDCKQVGLDLRSDDETATLKMNVTVAKTTPTSTNTPWRLVKKSMWTAVPFLCVVGWHLFQTYDC